MSDPTETRWSADTMMPWAAAGGTLLAGLCMNWFPHDDGWDFSRVAQGWPGVFYRHAYFFSYASTGYGRGALALNGLFFTFAAVIAGVATRMLIQKQYTVRLMLVLTIAICLVLGTLRLASNASVKRVSDLEIQKFF